MIIVFLGPPGSGKGTQRQLLAVKLGAPSIATGDIVRKYAARAGTGDPLADEIHERYVKGVPQPDELINKAMDQAVGALDKPKGVIFDAYPLSAGQAEGFAKLVKKYNLGTPKIVFLEVSLESVLRRLKLRKFCRLCHRAYLPQNDGYKTGVCPHCGGQLYVRPDDKPEVVEKRYEEYERRGSALHEYYRQRPSEGEWIEVNGDQPVETVHNEIVKKLGIES